MVDKKKRPRRRKVVKASDKKGGASATASSTVIVNVGGRRSRKPPTTLATFRPPSVAFTQPQMQPQFTSDNVKTAVGEALKTALPKFYQIGEDMPSKKPTVSSELPFTRETSGTQTEQKPIVKGSSEETVGFLPFNEDATTEAGYMRPPQFVPEQTTKITQFFRPESEYSTRLEDIQRRYDIAKQTPHFTPEEDTTQARMQQQEAEAEATLTQPIRKPRAEPKAYDYSAITADDISRMEIATGNNNTKVAENQLKKALRENYYGGKQKEYMSPRQYLDQYLAKKEGNR